MPFQKNNKLGVKHGMKGTPVYRVWSNMLNRCYNPNHKLYNHYGGRGIEVCERWHKFENFYFDMGEPSGLTLERINNYKGYFPNNCKWATPKEQARNRRYPGGKGYSWKEREQKYEIILTRDNKAHSFGYYKTEQEAQEKAEAARIVLDIFPCIENILTREVAA